jgi:MoxR-like ATPase
VNGSDSGVDKPGGEHDAAGGSPRFDTISRIRRAVTSVVVGNEDALDQLLIALLCRGHVLVEDVPGVGKTLLARSLANVLGCNFARIQLTPDVLPSDITGSNVFNQGSAQFEFRPGPIFTQILLADEINRATPRSQSALLEAMEERQVTSDGVTHRLVEPFFLLATQNPIELEGTFPLPEAQLDRFLLRVTLGYPSNEQEFEILRRFEHDIDVVLEPVTNAAELLDLQRQRASILVSDDVRSYLVAVARETRTDARLRLGASPRATLALHRACQARALLHDRDYVLPDDVKALAVPVFAHRLILDPAARLRGTSAEEILAEIVERLAVPVEDDRHDEAAVTGGG